MERTFDEALHRLYQREFTTRQEILREFLRVKLTMKELGNQSTDKDTLFKTMKQHTEDDLGFFPADREDFHALVDVLHPLEPIPFVLAVFENDRSALVPVPTIVTDYDRARPSRSPVDPVRGRTLHNMETAPGRRSSPQTSAEEAV